MGAYTKNRLSMLCVLLTFFFHLSSGFKQEDADLEFELLNYRGLGESEEVNAGPSETNDVAQQAPNSGDPKRWYQKIEQDVIDRLKQKADTLKESYSRNKRTY